MWPVIDTPPEYVQLVMAIGCTVMGISHIAQPQLWVEFFGHLHRQGTAGLVTKVMLVELWPALLIVSMHQVWRGPAVVLTIVGWLLLTKVVIGLIVPALAMRSMAIPQSRPKAFLPAGIALLVAAAASIWALASPG